MPRTETYALHVKLSASQTRKRLKGHGFGVKRVEATDRNQAMVTHTATGDHLQQLELLFADVLFSTAPADRNEAVESPPPQPLVQR